MKDKELMGTGDSLSREEKKNKVMYSNSGYSESEGIAPLIINSYFPLEPYKVRKKLTGKDFSQRHDSIKKKANG